MKIFTTKTNYTKTAFAFLAVLFCLMMKPETGLGQTIISPTGDGGFELGTSFAANGWSTANDGNNQWYTGTAAKTLGNNGAYIDLNANGANGNTYNNNSARTSYIYKDVVFPAGATNITLSFKWRAVGENAGGPDQYDFLRVFLPSTTVTPVGGTLLATNATNNVIGTGKYNLSSATTFSTSTIALASGTYAGTTKRLIFCWTNDGAAGSNPPAAIDEVSLTYTLASPVITASALAAFGNVCINTTTNPNSFTITGTNLTTADVTVGALAGFTYSTTSGGTYTTSLTLPQSGGSFSQIIYVKFSPVAVQSYNGSIAVGGGGAASISVAASGSGVNSPPTVTASAATGVTLNSATIPGTIPTTGCSALTAYGVEYSTTNGFANGSGIQMAGSNLSGINFSVPLSGLTQSTIYYYHTFATNSAGTVYSSQLSFTTLTPTLTASALTGFGTVCINTTAGPNSFTITGTNLTAADVTVGALTGFTYSTTSGGAYTASLTLPQSGGSFSQIIYVQFSPVAVQSYNGNIAVGGGGAASINEAASGSGVNSPPTVTASAATGVTLNSATIPGTIPTTGCSAISAYGVEYSTTNNFANGTGTPVAGSNLSGINFSVPLSGLTQSTTYYYHTFATNSAGTVYSSQLSFTTPTPTITASALAAFGPVCINTTTSPNSFTITGTNLTAADVTVGALTGFTYSTTSGGTYTASLTLPQSGGSFSQIIYVKFSPVAVQTYNGNIPVGGGGAASVNVTASGSGVNSPPTVTASAATGVTINSATIPGTIPTTGCSALTAYGVEYSTINNFANGTGTPVAGSNLSGINFSVPLSGLTQSTTYYYHTFATNSAGAVYSSQLSFTTPTPTLTASALTAFGNVCINTTVGPNSFTITGTNLSTANVTVGTLAGFTYSTTSGGTYTASLTLSQPGGSFSQQIFVKFTPVAVQSYNGNIVLGGGGAASINVAASGSGINTAPTVIAGAATGITAITATIPGTIPTTGCSAITAYGVEYSTTNGFTPGTGTQVAGSNLSGVNFSVPLSGLTQTTTYYYRTYATNGGGTVYSGQLNFTTATPGLSASALTAFGYICTNSTAGPNSFTITGTNLTTANVSVGALTGFTYSTTSGGTYTASLSLTQPGGSFSQTIYVKFSPVAVQSYNGNIALGGGGASSVNVAASGSGTTTGSWIGVTSTNWFTTTNWGCGIVPTATTDVIIPASGVTFQPTIGAANAVCRSITNNGTLTISGAYNLDVYGDWTNNGTFTPSTGSITFKGSTNNTMSGSAATTFYNLIIYKGATANTVTSTTKAFTVTSATGGLTVTQGDLILTATDVSYSVTNITVPAAGILTDNVNWDGTHLLSVTGNIAIDGIFNYTSPNVPHVNMNGAGSKTVRSGTNAASGFGFLTLSTGNYTADGQLVVNSNFWAMFGTGGSFSANGQIITAKATLLIDGGTVNINGTPGGTVNVTGGMLVGYRDVNGNGLSGIVNFSTGTLNADAVTVGTITASINGTFNHSGGTANIGNLLINNTNTTSNYTCSNSPVINITGNWTNNETDAASFAAANSQVNFNGTAASTIAGLSPTFYNLSIANAAGVFLSTNTNVSHTLNLANGLITPTGANVLTVTSTGTAITGGSNSSYVNGKLAKIFGTNGASSYKFPIGKGGNYRPLTFAYSALSSQPSTITVEQFESALTGTLPTNITLYPARYWDVTQSGGTNMNYTVTLDPTGYTPVGPYVKILKKETGTITATDATTPNYTNSVGFTTFNNTNDGTNSFALAHDCSSTASAGTALDPICQGTTSLPLGGSISGTATGGMWSSSAGGTFSPSATNLNATWTPPSTYFGTATLTLTPTGGLCTPNTADSKTQVVTPLPSGIDTIKETSGNAPNDNNICVGSAITFSATAGYSSYIFKVDGNVQQTGPAHAYSTSSLGVGDHIITVDVSSSNCGVTFGPDVVHVYALPAPTLNADKTSICPGDTVTFNAGGGTNYNFKVNGSSVQSSTSSIYKSATLSNGDTVTVDVTNINGCIASSSKVTITVNTLPVVSAITGKTSVCVGSTTALSSSPTGGTWSSDNITVATVDASGVVTGVASGTATISYKVTNGSGCSTTVTALVNVYALPTGTVTIAENSGIANDSMICKGANVKFTSTATGTDYKFYLNGTGAPIQQGATNFINLTTLNNGDYITVLVTNGNTCTATFTSNHVTVIDLPAGTLTASANPICAGDQVNFTATSGFSNYNFKRNGVTFQNGPDSLASYTGFVNGDKVSVVVSTLNSCSAIFDTLTIAVNPLPTGTLVPVENSGNAPNDSVICKGDSIVFTATSGFTNYNFKLNGTTVKYSPANTYTTDTLHDGDVVTVEVISAFGCIASFNTATITVHTLPSVPAITGKTAVCIGDTIHLSDAKTGGIWTSSNNVIATINSSGIVTGIAAGTDTIYYTVTNTNGCSKTVSTVITVNALPVVGQITGLFNICTNTYSQLSDTTSGGVWMSSNLGVVAITNSTTGLVEGISAGTAIITYVVTNANGCTAQDTALITVALTPTVASITTTAPSFDVCVSSTIPLKDATSGGVWRSSDPTLATINSNGIVTGIAAGMDTIFYTINTTCNTTVADTQIVIIHALPTAYNITPTGGSAAYCNGGAGVDIGLDNSQTGVNYQLQIGGVNTGSPIAGTTGSAISFGLQTTAGTYTVVATNTSTGCTSNMNGSVMVSINPLPTVYNVTGGGAYCSGGSGVVIGLSGSQTGVNYQLYNGATPSGSSVSGTGMAISFGNQTATGTYTVVATNNSTTCTANMNGNVMISINPLPTVYDVTGGGGYCSGGSGVPIGLSGSETGVNYQLYNGTTPVGTPLNGTGNAINFGNQTAAGIYTVVAVNTSTTCTATMNGSVMVSINPLPTIYTITGGGAYCSGGSGVAIGLSGSQNGVNYQLYNGATPSGSPVGGTGMAISFGNQTAIGTYTVVATNASTTCTSNMSGTVMVSINPLPTATIIVPANVCKNATAVVAFVGANGTAPYTFTYTVNGGSNQMVVSTGDTAKVAIPTGTVTSYTYALISVKDNSTTMCSKTIIGQSGVVTVNDIPTITLLPYSTPVCQSDIVSLTATSTGNPVTTTQPFPSGNVNVNIPDATSFIITFPGEANSSLNVSGIPAGAVITNISVNLNISHNRSSDLNFNIKAPNGQILNLINRDGGNTNSFSNTTVAWFGGVAFPANGPYNGIYIPDAQGGVGPGGGQQTTNTFSNLKSVPNGTWTLYAEDAKDNGVGGTINSWSVIIEYSVPLNNPVTWSPVTDLYTDAGATTPYTGQNLTTVYVKPSSSGMKTYTATATNASNCTNSVQANINVGAPPMVNISADYCAVPGQVVLTANASGVTYKWSNGKTTDTIHVDEAGDYSITVTSTTTGCKGYATINVAKELVTNGDFSAGNTGFTSDYTYVPDLPSYNGELVPDGADSGYSISTSGQNVHNNFWGYDHTTGDGTQNYMLVNGHLTNTHNTNDTLVVWKETVNVLPGTTYYFSAWAMSLNNVGPFAQLKFSVNDSLVGTTAVLASGTNSNSNKSWVRFYGTWTAPANITSANIYINDLQPSQNGNDFGLDDISFATLSTFVTLDPSSGSDAQVICVNTPLIPIIYNYGNGNSHPKVTGLPAGIDTTFSGDKLTISGTPTVAGNYTYSVTTTGCSPFTVTGTITVNQQKLTLTSGNASPTICINGSVGNIVYMAANTDGTAVTNVIVKGLPHGVGTGSGYNTSTKTITISGSPDTAGVFKDTVITVGACKADTAYGTITVQNQTITLSSNNSNQTVCINTPIINVEYALGGTATGASITAGSLPTGVTGSISGSVNGPLFIISGTPRDSGTFIVTISTSGATCPPVATIKDTIVVKADAIITLTSASKTDSQTVCRNSPITTITYAIGGSGNNASISWSPSAPPGMINPGSYSGGVYTISGTPSATGVFDYTITATGTCGTTNVSGTLTVQSSTIDLTSGSGSPTLCLGSTLTPIVFTTGGNVTGASITNWSPTTPADISGTYSNGTFTISSNGNPLTQLGTFTYTITTSGGCAPDTSVSGTITVNSGTIGGTLPDSVSACYATMGLLSLSGSVGTIQNWEFSTDGGSNWTPLMPKNTSTTLQYNLTVPTRYRALVKSGSCSAQYSDTAYVGIHNLWTGATSTDWNIATNWSDNQVASTTCSIIVIPSTPNKPQLTSDVTIPGIMIASGTTLDLSNHTLTVNGAVSGTGTLRGSAASGLVITTSGNAGTLYFDQTTDNTTNVLKTFTLNSGSNTTLGNALNITAGTGGAFGSTSGTLIANGILNAGNNLTIKSGFNGDAVVGPSTGTISGNVVVERYIPPLRAWRFVTAPVNSSQTINQAWQEGQVNTGFALGIDKFDNKPGYGTQITYNNLPADGYDRNTTLNPSIRYWVPSANDFLPLPSGTLTTNINAYPAYYLFVRGSRAVDLSLAVSAPADPTVLRANGTLAEIGSGQNEVIKSSGTLGANQYFFVGNPYASPINLDKVLDNSRTQGYKFKQFWVWDPKLSGSMGVGAYVANSNGVWQTPGGSYAIGDPPVIQSGQGFMVQLDNGYTNTSLKFSQTDKFATELTVFGKQEPSLQTVFYTSLMKPSGNNLVLMDGVAAAFGKDNAPVADKKNASKKWNTQESIGLYRNNTWQAIEFRPIPVLTDTLFYAMYYMNSQTYTLKIMAKDVPPGFPQAWLIDKYLNTTTALDVNTPLLYSFTANSDVKSYQNRFMLVFKRGFIATPIPVTKVTNQANPGTTGSANSIAQQGSNVSVHPNPIVTGEKVMLQFSNMNEGRYQVTVTNTLGKALAERTIDHDGGSNSYSLQTDARWAAGSYFIKITGENGYSLVTKLVISK